MLGREMTCRDYLLNELNTTWDALFTGERRRSREIADQRWVIFCFYKLCGMANNWIAMRTSFDHNTIGYALNNASEEIWAKARYIFETIPEHLIPKSVETRGRKRIHPIPDVKIKQKQQKFRKVPDYKNNCIRIEEYWE